MRHSGTRAISAIAGLALQHAEWATLPGILLEVAEQGYVSHREVAVYILFTLLEAVGDGFADKIPDMFQLFSQAIPNSESSNSIMALGMHELLYISYGLEDQNNLESR